MALWVLRRVGFCIGKNKMCHLCGWLKLFLKNVRWEKIKIQKRWLLGRLSDGSFVQSLYVYFCRSFLLCRLLGLQVTYHYLRRRKQKSREPPGPKKSDRLHGAGISVCVNRLLCAVLFVWPHPLKVAINSRIW